MKMFGCDEPEELRDEISRLKKEHEHQHSAMTARLDKLTDLLGDLCVFSDQITGDGRFDWEDSQTEYYSRGLESKLMGQAKAMRDLCVGVRSRLRDGLAALGVDPRQVGTQARARRQADEKRARAEDLRRAAARLDEEASQSDG
jgi:hypothetical protein